MKNKITQFIRHGNIVTNTSIINEIKICEKKLNDTCRISIATRYKEVFYYDIKITDYELFLNEMSLSKHFIQIEVSNGSKFPYNDIV